MTANLFTASKHWSLADCAIIGTPGDVAANVTSQLTGQQIAWAKSHDWFIAMHASGCPIVANRYTVNGGPLQEDLIVWDRTFRQLRDFAGY